MDHESEEVVRVCANDLEPLLPKQKAYCSTMCKLVVQLWRAKVEAFERKRVKRARAGADQ